MKNLTAIIVTMLRDEYLKKCLSSLRETYPTINILVGDNGHESKEREKLCEKYGAEYFKMPFDSGVCFARNRLVERVKTDYVLIGDDDFFYTKIANVDLMLSFLRKNTELDLLAGRVIEGDLIRNYQGKIKFGEDYIVLEKTELNEYEEKDGLRFKRSDLVFNYFVAKTKAIKSVKWDEEIKVAYEHLDYFISLKRAEKKVAFTPDALVIHKPFLSMPISKEYLSFRSRKNDREYFFIKHGLAYVIDMNGYKDSYSDRNYVEDIDFIIKTLNRKDSLEKLLFSIAKYYPEAKIVVADDGKKFDASYYKDLWKRLLEAGLHKKPVAYSLPYDSGLSFGRNFLIGNTYSDYILMLDDDFVFTERTSIKKLKSLIDSDNNIGAVGGCMQENGIDVHFEHLLEKSGNILFHRNDGDNWKDYGRIKYKFTDCVLNFVLFRRKVFETMSWDNDIKIQGEHTDFYLRLKDTDWKVVYCPEVKIDHCPNAGDEEYLKMRKRLEFLKIFMKKHELKKMIYLSGRTYELKNNQILEYKKIYENIDIGK